MYARVHVGSNPDPGERESSPAVQMGVPQSPAKLLSNLCFESSMFCERMLASGFLSDSGFTEIEKEGQSGGVSDRPGLELRMCIEVHFSSARTCSDFQTPPVHETSASR